MTDETIELEATNINATVQKEDPVQEQHRAIVVGVVGQKGGVGKSAISRSLAREAANNGFDTKIADMDYQQTTSKNWQQDRLAANIKPDVYVEIFRHIEQTKKILKNHDIVIIDTPPRSSEATKELAEFADILVLPTGPSKDDLRPTISLYFALEDQGIQKKKLFIALSRIGTKTEEAVARSYCEAAGTNVLPGCIYEKTAFRTALNKGKSLTETSYKGLSASADNLIQSLIDELVKNV